MISETILLLRKKLGYSQETLAEKVGVSRQTLSKWELGESLPDIVASSRLAEIFDISLDELVNGDDSLFAGKPKEGKYIFGTVTVGEKGQIVIPVRARKVFNIKKGDSLMVLGDINQGLALLNSDFFVQAFEEMGLMK
ncbi:helix-turn-helix domain-containing protein [Streptococcus ratti]|uniref:Cro/CI family transcriptional regulator putative n=1 Tax=Streptococcus ratti FA-1 = DSM 20564 TaxID=699248 RepID=A0ABN0GSQ4_STRRT|nr:helix-turn-helix domain-containing protein [Streptococcus ratti]EJN93441.1 Cro/CI family transcriptional regulator putative [Streptococcus ratti FA-1 = DSM 20564]EMP71674.1 Cro/CI family transcriptional regulator putative [Streptococcus ratti FA-1 = DSM 20564]QEY07325.1 helix-turn-helix domain-containing protein [Streptococcus ratti]VEI59765.1 Cro/CI family transcriptional regulator putative [Streptococcus mutans]